MYSPQYCKVQVMMEASMSPLSLTAALSDHVIQ